MALEIITREYATGAAGFTAMVADLKTMANWSEVNENSDGRAFFKMYNDETGDSYVGFDVQNTTSYPTVIPISSNGAQSYSVAVTPSGFSFRFINFVKWSGGFCAHGTYEAALPCTNANFVNFGVSQGKFENSRKWCSWGFAIGKTFVGSEDTTSTSAGAYNFCYAGKLTTATPIAYPHSRYIVDSVLKIDMTQETYMNTAGYCTWNGKRYYKNGCMMIPA